MCRCGGAQVATVLGSGSGITVAVYVDDAFIPFGRMVMCHMVADTHEELVAMADRIGVQRRWIQNAGQAREHFDVSKGARQKAIDAGAIVISWRALGVMLAKRKADRSLEFTPGARVSYFDGGGR